MRKGHAIIDPPKGMLAKITSLLKVFTLMRIVLWG